MRSHGEIEDAKHAGQGTEGGFPVADGQLWTYPMNGVSDQRTAPHEKQRDIDGQ
jgi:hypothetical protein